MDENPTCLVIRIIFHKNLTFLFPFGVVLATALFFCVKNSNVVSLSGNKCYIFVVGYFPTKYRQFRLILRYILCRRQSS